MNLWRKAVILLIVFNQFEYSMAACDSVGEGKVAESERCAYKRFGRTFTEEDAVSRQSTGDVDCCLHYYQLCNSVETSRRECSTDNKETERIRSLYEEAMKCKPTKDKCDKYHSEVDKKCNQYKYSECEAYTWSSFVPISANGLLICLSVFASILFVR